VGAAVAVAALGVAAVVVGCLAAWAVP